jgi:hypothetical protein
MRKEQRLELTDWIVLTVPESDADLVERHGEWIKREVLALEIRLGPELRIDKAESRE